MVGRYSWIVRNPLPLDLAVVSLSYLPWLVAIEKNIFFAILPLKQKIPLRFVPRRPLS
jgi:hypothetical protein